MITIPQNSLVINDARKSQTYNMKYTLTIDFSILSKSWIVDASQFAARNTNISEIVINCKGGPGYLEIGNEKFELKDAHLFSKLKGFGINKIWFVTSELAQVQPKGKNNRDGEAFISAIAKAADCYVVASSAKQTSSVKNYPPNKLDSFEGLVKSFDPKGKISWHKDYGNQFAWE